MFLRRRRSDPAAGLGDLEAALHAEGCPVCTRAAGADERWLDRFLDDGYLERDLMRRIAAGGGFCAAHADRMSAIGHSATVALIYLSLIADCLPRLEPRREHHGRPVPLFPGPQACAACAHRHDVERREGFFLALLLRTRGLACYGAPALVCMPHLPVLLTYLAEEQVGDVIARHRRAVAALTPAHDADRVLRLILGPPPPSPPAEDSPILTETAGLPDPVQRMRRRLRDLPSCAICAEIAEAGAEWLGWLAQASGDRDRIADILPLCPAHVWQAHRLAGSRLAPALASVLVRESGQRLRFAAEGAAACREWRPLLDRIGRIVGASPARRAAIASLRRGRPCPLCQCLRETEERALALVAALVESGEGRRAFEDGYGLCLRHAARAMAMPTSPTLCAIVVQISRARLLLLRWELEEQLRRGAWQARAQRRGAESAAWLTAGARFAGTVRYPPY